MALGWCLSTSDICSATRQAGMEKNPALISCFPQSAFIKGSKIITSASALSEPIKANRVMSKAVVHPPSALAAFPYPWHPRVLGLLLSVGSKAASPLAQLGAPAAQLPEARPAALMGKSSPFLSPHEGYQVLTPGHVKHQRLRIAYKCLSVPPPPVRSGPLVPKQRNPSTDSELVGAPLARHGL